MTLSLRVSFSWFEVYILIVTHSSRKAPAVVVIHDSFKAYSWTPIHENQPMVFLVLFNLLPLRSCELLPHWWIYLPISVTDHTMWQLLFHAVVMCRKPLVDCAPPISHNVNIQTRFVQRRMHLITCVRCHSTRRLAGYLALLRPVTTAHTLLLIMFENWFVYH
jgi:hypothetical protein